MDLSVKDLLLLKTLKDFLNVTFKGASFGDLKADDCIYLLEKMIAPYHCGLKPETAEHIELPRYPFINAHPVDGHGNTHQTVAKSEYDLLRRVTVHALDSVQFARRYIVKVSEGNLGGGVDPVRFICSAHALLLEQKQAASALHASAPTGYMCSDCSMDKEPCPDCYRAWWQKKYPNNHLHDIYSHAEALQAEIDRLMLEYCPDEMTKKQKQRWEDNQRAVNPEVEAQVNAAVKGSLP